MRLRSLLRIVLALPALAAPAAETTPDQAASAVRAWLAQAGAFGFPADAEVASVERFGTEGDGAARPYVAALTTGGFVVVAGDDGSDPILAFRPSGSVPAAGTGDPFWTLVFADLAARRASPDAAERARRRWAELLGTDAGRAPALRLRSAARSAPPAGADIRVDSFLETHWGQTTHDNTENGFPCFNLYVPEQYPCGCVATVGAQIMRHWEWPQGGIRPFSRTCWTNDVPVVLQVLATNAYDWASMPFVPGTNETERAAIGRLTHDVAVSVGMQWTPAGGGSSPYVLGLRLKDTFGYSNAVPVIFYPNAYPYSLEEVKRIVVPNCDVRAPVAMSISGEMSGVNYSHAVVVDGYGYSGGEFCLHVNFGWSGLSDAWYFPPAFGEYSAIDGFVFNVFPESTGSVVSGRVFDESGAPVDGAVVELRGASNVLFQTTSSDARGFYGFVTEPGTYRVAAAWGQASGEIEVSAGETKGTEIVESTDGGLYVYSANASVGNTFDNDIVLSGLSSVPAPVFDPGSCLFHPSTNVVLSCADPDARIHYTLDGATPTPNSPLYSGPIFIDATVTIRARAFVTGKNPSPVVSATYAYDDSADAPEGDLFADPIVLSGESGRHVLPDNARYTVEQGEPYHTLDEAGAYQQTRTVWHLWTAPRSGILVLRTSAEDDDYLWPTAVAVYRGDSLATAERLGFGAEPDENDDWATGMETFVAAGETYRIVGMMTWNPADAPDAPVSFSLEWALKTETAGAPVPVPYDWLTAHWPGSGTDAAACEALALEDADGDGFPAWAEYAANTDPTNAADRLRCDISFGANGAVTLGVFPETAREGYPRVLQGKVRLDDRDWTDLSAPAEPYRFFRCVIRPSP